jgi:hypothetical protein
MVLPVKEGPDSGGIHCYRSMTVSTHCMATIPRLTQHRCLQCHNISRLSDVEVNSSNKRKFKAYSIGYFHIDIAEVQTAEGRLYLFVTSTERPSPPSPNCIQKSRRVSPQTFCTPWSTPCKSTPC